MPDPLFASSSPPEADAEVDQVDIFSSIPPVFILPTHLSLDGLHDAESRLVNYGGNITYDIAEAGLILGSIGQKKRAALELRSRGIWTQDVSEHLPADEASLKDSEPPLKRRRSEQHSQSGGAENDIDLSTESDSGSEKDTVQNRSRHPKHLLQTADDQKGSVLVIKLEWLDESIKAGKPLPKEPYMVYHGQKKIVPTVPAETGKQIGATGQKSNQIIQRAKEDAALQSPPVSSSRFGVRRSKESFDRGSSSQRQPPTLYRQTTSEHDEPTSLPPTPDWVRDQVLYACMRSAPLHPANEKFISQLEKIRRIRELTLDDIGVRAYSTSIAALAAYPYTIHRPNEIIALPGCDVKIANLFAEFQQHDSNDHSEDDGTVSAAAALETDPVLRVLHTFYNIWGVGAKTARDFYYHRGWRDLDDIVEHGWNSLSRVQQIGVKFYDEFLAGVPRPESESIVAIIRRHANLVRPDAGNAIDCIIVGGYRRGKEISGDVDIMISHRDDAVTRNLVLDLVASLEKEHYITHTLALNLTSSHREQQTVPFRGDAPGKHFDSLDKALVVWQDPHFDIGDVDVDENTLRKKNPNPHRRVDIIISPWRTVGCAVLGWSGDTTFQRDLRRYAKKAHAWKFDSSGVRERTTGGQVVDLEHGGETWQERERLVMERLGVGWRPPEERCTR
ncbi:hypothetical protein N7474_007424 [Penicillium riverlandense]|uniref:uncharacterized protein n=1 Tax=Penicillium riverlandense TaxID=1903569 RepID=UPI0025483A6E|nr:uncharacterized protein N7474_007424 [Penicillium riverlandense]KAJ5815647.1 hypothetical protein N7474_007424 [Penicillium riverlandense]